MKCVCGFEGDGTVSTFSAEWHRQHRRAHLRAFPGLDQRSRDALDQDVRLAERRELSVVSMQSILDHHCPHDGCVRAFGSALGLDIHIDSVHGGKRAPETKAPPPPSDRFPCSWPDCERVFLTEEKLSEHAVAHALGEVTAPPTGNAIAGFPCPVEDCVVVKDSQGGLELHGRVKHKDLGGVLAVLSPAERKRRQRQGDEWNAERERKDAKRSTGAVLTTPAARAAGEEDTADDQSDDAGSSPAPRSQEEPEGEGEPMAPWGKAELCSVPACREAGKLAGHWGAHKGQRATTAAAAARKSRKARAPRGAKKTPGRRSSGRGDRTGRGSTARRETPSTASSGPGTTDIEQIDDEQVRRLVQEALGTSVLVQLNDELGEVVLEALAFLGRLDVDQCAKRLLVAALEERKDDPGVQRCIAARAEVVPA